MDAVWRASDREKLIRYNVEDCDALELAAQTIIQLSQARSQIGSPSVNAAVEVERMKPERPLVFKRNSFFFPELSTINNAAYWDYQRERVYVRSNSLLRKALRKTGDTKRPRPNNPRSVLTVAPKPFFVMRITKKPFTT